MLPCLYQSMLPYLCPFKTHLFVQEVMFFFLSMVSRECTLQTCRWQEMRPSSCLKASSWSSQESQEMCNRIALSESILVWQVSRSLASFCPTLVQLKHYAGMMRSEDRQALLDFRLSILYGQAYSGNVKQSMRSETSGIVVQCTRLETYFPCFAVHDDDTMGGTWVPMVQELMEIIMVTYTAVTVSSPTAANHIS